MYEEKRKKDAGDSAKSIYSTFLCTNFLIIYIYYFFL